MDAFVSRKALVRGARWFAALTVLGLGGLVVVSGGDTLAVLAGMSPGFMALALAAAVADLLIGGARYQIFLRRIRDGSPFSLPIRADLANRFAGALTPSQTGGGPAQLFILHRGGIPVVDALPFLAINFVVTMAFFLGAGGGTAWLLRDALPGGGVAVLMRWAFAVFVALGGLSFVALVRPDLVEQLAGRAIARWDGSSSRAAAGLHRAALWAVENLGRYRATCARFVREEPSLLVWSFLLTALLYWNKFTLGWLILRGLGADAPYLEVLAVQTLLQLILFVAPSPGGSGIAEVTTAALMSPFLETHMLAAFTAIFRCLLLYGPAALGCVILMAALRPPGGGGSTARLPAESPGSPGEPTRATRVMPSPAEADLATEVTPV